MAVKKETELKKLAKIEKIRQKKTPVYCFVNGCNKFEGVYMKQDDPERHTWKCSHCTALEKRDDSAAKRHKVQYLEHAEELESPICLECGEDNDKCKCAGCTGCGSTNRATCRCGAYRDGSGNGVNAAGPGEAMPPMPKPSRDAQVELRGLELEGKNDLLRITNEQNLALQLIDANESTANMQFVESTKSPLPEITTPNDPWAQIEGRMEISAAALAVVEEPPKQKKKKEKLVEDLLTAKLQAQEMKWQTNYNITSSSATTWNQ